MLQREHGEKRRRTLSRLGNALSAEQARLAELQLTPSEPAELDGFGALEALSKSSQAVAGRTISALPEFGLDPPFLTPNKELLRLRRQPRSAILIHRKGQQAKLSSLCREELKSAPLRRGAGMKSPAQLAHQITRQRR